MGRTAFALVAVVAPNMGWLIKWYAPAYPPLLSLTLPQPRASCHNFPVLTSGKGGQGKHARTLPPLQRTRSALPVLPGLKGREGGGRRQQYSVLGIPALALTLLFFPP